MIEHIRLLMLRLERQCPCCGRGMMTGIQYPDCISRNWFDPARHDKWCKHLSVTTCKRCVTG